MFPSSSIPKEDLAVFPRNTEEKFLIVESDANTNYSEYRQQYGNSSCQNNSGLLRFRSAPSSLLANFANGFEKSESLTSRVRTDEANDMYGFENNDDGNDKSSVKGLASVNSQLPPQYPRQSSAQLRSVAMDGGEHRVVSSMDSSLTRQNSSPAGLFSHPIAQNGYPTTRWIRDLSPSSSRSKNHINFSSDMSSSLGMLLSQITEVENENSRANGLQDDVEVENSCDNNLFNNSGLIPFGSWNNSLNFAGNFTSVIKREADNDGNLFANNLNMESGNRPHSLSHNLSLPKTSTEMSPMKKLLHIQDTVPCKIRAKRGFATHPRSIAERIRRTRISERIRKLQELVPNMDKQTNTADMLDLAVEHIKNLQKQYKKLSENRAKCKCLPLQEIV